MLENTHFVVVECGWSAIDSKTCLSIWPYLTFTLTYFNISWYIWIHEMEVIHIINQLRISIIVSKSVFPWIINYGESAALWCLSVNNKNEYRKHMQHIFDKLDESVLFSMISTRKTEMNTGYLMVKFKTRSWRDLFI